MDGMNDAELKQQYEDAFRRSEDAYGIIKQNSIADSKFANGEQWPALAQQSREMGANPRPCIVVNKAAPLVRRVVNEAKHQKFEIKVKPVDDHSDTETAEILAGMIRNVEYNSRATEAYMWALNCAVTGGLGYFRLDNEYENSTSFDQTIRINKVLNPLSVCWDADSDAIDGRDARVVCLYDYISEEKADNILYKFGSRVDKKNRVWYRNKQVKVGEMFWVIDQPDELLQLEDGSKIKKSETDKEALKMIEAAGKVARRRDCFTRKVKWCYLVNGEVVEKTDINSIYIPVVPVFGRQSYIEGKRDFKGIVRDSKDSCRMYNYMSSLIVEQIGLAPRVPYIGAEGQFEGHPEWNDANVSNYGYLEYKPVTIGGVMAPAPRRENGPSADPSVERYLIMSENDIKATSGIYDSSVGRVGAEKSGRAINAMAALGNLANFDFIDNLAYSIEQAGRICVDMLPRITSAETIVRVMGADGKERKVQVGKEFQDEDTGEIKKFVLDAGQYDVECDVQSGDLTRRERANELLQPLMNNPDMAKLLGDIFVGNIDMKDGEKAARRLKATLPPDVLAAENDDEGGGQKPNPELDALQQQAEQVITQLKGQMDALNAEYVKVKAAAEQKDAENRLKEQELALKSREVDIKDRDSKAAIIGGSVQALDENTALKAEVEHLSKEMDLVLAALEKLYAAGGPPRPAQQGEADQTSPPNNFTLPEAPQSGEAMTSGPTQGDLEEPPSMGNLE